MDLPTVWERTLQGLTRQLGPQNVEIWLRPSAAVRLDGDVLYLEVANRYYSDWISENYLEVLQREFGAQCGRSAHVEFVYREDATDEVPRSAVDGAAAVPEAPRAIGVNATKTFDNFVVGECNKFAHAAAAAVRDSPAKAYNPLFIFAASGLGKTHLMHAIGNGVLARDPNARVLYVTAEEFMTDMINGLRYKRMDEFRDRYRRLATVLLVDDIQFLSGKQGTQEEFFHTFNALQSQDRQIVLTADVEPKEIVGLDPRLRTRFEQGLSADMKAPTKEVLLAILAQKADNLKIRVPADVADAITQQVRGNVRELEGHLNRIQALQRTYPGPITMDFVREHMSNLFVAVRPPTLTPGAVIEAVARYHGLRPADLTGAKRTKILVRPRHLAMYLARKHTGLSFPELGREFGSRDHSTIQHGCNRVEEEMATNPDVEHRLSIIEQALGVAGRKP